MACVPCGRSDIPPFECPDACATDFRGSAELFTDNGCTVPFHRESGTGLAQISECRTRITTRVLAYDGFARYDTASPDLTGPGPHSVNMEPFEWEWTGPTPAAPTLAPTPSLTQRGCDYPSQVNQSLCPGTAQPTAAPVTPTTSEPADRTTAVLGFGGNVPSNGPPAQFYPDTDGAPLSASALDALFGTYATCPRNNQSGSPTAENIPYECTRDLSLIFAGDSCARGGGGGGRRGTHLPMRQGTFSSRYRPSASCSLLISGCHL